MKAIILSFLFYLTYLFIIGCKGDKGDTGSTGPQGQTGLPGNANITIVDFQVLPSQWLALDYYNVDGYYSKYIPQLTQHLADSGLVNVDIQTKNGWMALPWSSYSYSYEKDTVSVFKNDTTSVAWKFKISLADKN